MDVDDATAALRAKEQKAKQQAKERDECCNRIELQKKTGTKGKLNKGGKKKKDEAEEVEDADPRGKYDDESTVVPEKGKGRG
jgi:hypothetical protein